jgi:hypothetical protein
MTPGVTKETKTCEQFDLFSSVTSYTPAGAGPVAVNGPFAGYAETSSAAWRWTRGCRFVIVGNNNATVSCAGNPILQP